MARFRAIISTAEPGIRSRAFLRRSGSPPAMAPMMRELTARPAHPQVMTKPMAVPVMRGKGSADDGQGGWEDRGHGESGDKDQGRGGCGLDGPQHEECSDGHGDGGGQSDVIAGT